MAEKISNPCGWSGTIQNFLSLSKAAWLASLQEHHQRCMNGPADQSQIPAWDHEFDILAKELKQLIQANPALGAYTIIFDYALPRERGRRSDLIILGHAIFVLEFEDIEKILPAHVDEVAADARDLKHYHAGSHQSTVIPILVLTQTKDLIKRNDDVIVISPNRIADVLTVESELESGSLIDPGMWIAA